MKILTIICLTFCFIINLHADSGAWTNSTGSNWDNNGNWTGNFPNGASQAAGFIGLPQSALTITSNSDITIGALHIDIPGEGITIDFGPRKLIFDNSGGDGTARLLVSSNLLITNIIKNEVVLQNVLEIWDNPNRSLSPNLGLIIEGPISDFTGSNGILDYIGDPVSIGLTLRGTNSYTGGTNIISGGINLDGAIGPTIPTNLFVFSDGICLTSKDNQFSSTSSVFVVGENLFIGYNFDLNGTQQEFMNLGIANNGTVFDSNSVLPGKITLLDSVNTLNMGSGFLKIGSLLLQNGGAIVYQPSFNFTHPNGQAFIGDSINPTTIDLNAHNVDLSIAHGPNEVFDMSMMNVDIQNGSLTKSGAGTLLFQGSVNTSIPALTVNEGAILIGLDSADVISTTGPTQINPGTTLRGFGTLGSMSGIANLINSGTVEPGTESDIGKLTLFGDYTQTAAGALLIKAKNIADADQLVVDEGSVTLDGTLIFDSLPGAVFLPGQQLVIIDNSSGSSPITTRFSTFNPNLPPNVSATIVYTPHQVLVRFSFCSCEQPLAPSNFVGVIRKCKFLNKTECVLEANWDASPSANVIFYRIYKNGRIVKEISSSSPLVFETSLEHCSASDFEIAAVDSDNIESAHVRLIIKNQ